MGGSHFRYHQGVKRDRAGPFFGIRWVPFVVSKTWGNARKKSEKLKIILAFLLRQVKSG